MVKRGDRDRLLRCSKCVTDSMANPAGRLPQKVTHLFCNAGSVDAGNESCFLGDGIGNHGFSCVGCYD